MNADNIVSRVPRISIKEATSQKNGNPYVQLILHFANDHKLRVFINEIFDIKDALRSVTG